MTLVFATGLSLSLSPKLAAKEITIEVVALPSLPPDHPFAAFQSVESVLDAFVTVTVPGMATVTGFTVKNGTLTVDLPEGATGLITVDKTGLQAFVAELPMGPDLTTTLLGDKVTVWMTREATDEEIKTDSPGTEVPVEIWGSDPVVFDAAAFTAMLDTFDQPPILPLYRDLATQQNNSDDRPKETAWSTGGGASPSGRGGGWVGGG